MSAYKPATLQAIAPAQSTTTAVQARSSNASRFAPQPVSQAVVRGDDQLETGVEISTTTKPAEDTNAAESPGQRLDAAVLGTLAMLRERLSKGYKAFVDYFKNTTRIEQVCLLFAAPIIFVMGFAVALLQWLVCDVAVDSVLVPIKNDIVVPIATYIREEIIEPGIKFISNIATQIKLWLLFLVGVAILCFSLYFFKEK
jgi:hypothetical protein